MFAVNAYEMSENGNYMVPYFDGEIDWRNSKPLLLTWIQVGCIKIFGFSEWSIRLPSAVAATSTILLIFSFCLKHINVFTAWCAALVLLSSAGFVTYHTARTGDSDSLLCFFLVAHIIFWLKWLNEENGVHLLVSILFLSLAFMTKSFAGLLFVMPVVVLTFIEFKGRLIEIVFKKWQFYLGAFIFIVAIFVVFYLREKYQPGFLECTFSHDAGRLGKVMEGHAHAWDFYIEKIFYERFVFWTISFILGVILIFKNAKEQIQKNLRFVLILIITYLVFISLSDTKLVWYDLPVLPLLAVIAGFGIGEIYKVLFSSSNITFQLIVFVVLFIIPFRQAFFRSQNNPFAPGDIKEEVASLYFQRQLKNNDEQNISIYDFGYQGSILCYKYMYQERDKVITIKRHPEFQKDELVFVSNDSLKNQILSLYKLDTVEVFHNAVIYKTGQ